MKLPSISIVTAVFNGATTIDSCLESVRRQSFAAEHVVVDGCSTDATVRIVSSRSPEARLISEPDDGIYDAMNKGIALCRGEVIGILNADDYYPDSSVLARVAAAFADPSVDCCYGDLLYVKTAGEVARHGEAPISPKVVRYWRSGEFAAKKFSWGWMPPHPTFFVRRSLYERFGRFRLDLGTAADYELMLRFLVRHRATCRYIPQIMVHMRCGGASNARIKSRLRANRMDRLAWQVNDLTPFPWTLTMKPLRKIHQYLLTAVPQGASTSGGLPTAAGT